MIKLLKGTINMKRYMIFVILALFASAANAYEYKYIDSNSQTKGIASYLASVVNFEDSQLTSIQKIKAKQNFAVCSVDEVAKDIIDNGLGDEEFSSVFEMVYSYHAYGGNRDFQMPRSDVIYVDEINFRCIDETPDKRDVIFSYVMSSAMFKAECSDNPSCFMPKKKAYFETLKSKYNVGD